jgi:hypothetical protein
MTMPRSRHAAPVIRRGPPNRPAQPLVHRDSPSVGMGSSRVLAGTRHRLRRVLARRRVPQQSDPACPGHSRKQMSGACFRRWGSGGDETPRISTSHTETAILRLPVPLGFSPAPSAALWHPLCSRRPPDANTVRVSTATYCVRWQLGLSRLARMLDHVRRAKRRSNPKARQAQPSKQLVGARHSAKSQADPSRAQNTQFC